MSALSSLGRGLKTVGIGAMRYFLVKGDAGGYVRANRPSDRAGPRIKPQANGAVFVIALR
jgi:hypothetical protein